MTTKKNILIMLHVVLHEAFEHEVLARFQSFREM